VADVRLDRQRFDPVRAQARVAAAEAGEVVGSRELEPDEVDRVVGDPLRVGLGEAHAHLGLEVEVHGGYLSTIPPSKMHEDELETDATPAPRLVAAALPP